MNRLLITICGRAGSKGFKNKNLKVFCGKPLVLLLAERRRAVHQEPPGAHRGHCAEHRQRGFGQAGGRQIPGGYLSAPRAELGGDRVPKMAVYQDSLRRMEARTGTAYDWHMDLDITSPLRTAADIENAFAEKQSRPRSGFGVQRLRGAPQPVVQYGQDRG